MKIERTFSVIKKELKGKAKTPCITMKSDDGDKLTLQLESRDHLANFVINQLWQIRIANEQQTIDPKDKFAAGIGRPGKTRD